jgi:putative hydrolase of the HAD superfamily
VTRRIEAILFDAVGTLIAPRQPVGEIYARVGADHGLAFSATELEGAFRRVFPQMDAMAFPDAPRESVPALERSWWRELVWRTFLAADPHARQSEVDAMFPALFNAFAAPEAWAARRGARSALHRVREAGRRCAVLSNFDYRLHDVLEGMDLLKFFEFVLLPGEVGAGKPDPRVFRAALEKLALPAAAVALVGDDESDDLEGARRAGIRGVDVRQLATLDDLEAHIAAIETTR